MGTIAENLEEKYLFSVISDMYDELTIEGWEIKKKEKG